MLAGRAEECARISLLLDEARDGRGGALVVHGEPGIGKTSLLEHAADQAGGMRIVRARGVETETSLPFAGLVDLLTPLTEYLPELSERQADAVRGALAIGPTREADRLAVLAGGFNLLCAAAAASPLVVLVDDAHWLDPASSEAITFAARRIGADRIAVLMATREDGHDGLPAVRLHPLTPGESRDVLERRGLNPKVLDGAVRGAEGNPLALLELARSQDGRFEPGHSTLEQAYARMAATLPEDCRSALVLLAATRSNSPVVIGRALADQGLTDAAFAPAERNGMVTVDLGRIGFRHPLIRSGVYTSATPADRRLAHESLAAACVELELG